MCTVAELLKLQSTTRNEQHRQAELTAGMSSA